MASKKTPTKIGTEVKSPAPTVAKVVTPVRNTAIPKVPARKEITNEMIATRAYYISISGQGGSEYDNWSRAEYELRNGVVG